MHCFLIKNNTMDALSFANDTILIPASSSITPTDSEWFKLTSDITFLKLVRFRNITLNDGVRDYTDEEVITVLSRTSSARILNSEGVEITETNPIPVAVTTRPTESRNRTLIVKNIRNTTGVIHTVTPGRLFYLTALGVTALNSSTNLGELAIQDSTTIIFPFLWQQNEVLTPPQPFVFSANFENNPVPFSTNITVTQLSGTLSASVYIVGYEE